MDTNYLKSFVAAVEEGSLSRAALREDIVISAMSKRIAELEREGGVTLLRRHGRGVSPTPAGTMLYQRAKSILKALGAAEDALSAYATDGASRLRLLANPSTTVQFLHKDLAPFLRTHTDCHIHLADGHSLDIPRRIHEGEADIGIYHAVYPAVGMKSALYRSDRVCLVVPISHPLADRKDIALKEVIDETFLGYFPRHDMASFLELAGETIPHPPKVLSEIANYEARCRMVTQELGIAIIPEIIARNYLAMMQFAIIGLRDHWAERNMYVCVRDLSSASSQVRDLFSHLSTCAPSSALKQ
ncbi:LysR family transcriptional regulator [Advenella kashmirensis W13003]|uniref:LysR family transcriptional regulator n=1 Tax=Advenella kashmirensis W13003 TaxID=1424334 RepID=V8QTK2_9BURK|nr:LysR family transcriptional regulator [Advenella kashmirensis]ETF02967.1 LysR family transcriptional regulator [Advenella kashmirensis W13003]